MDIELTEEIVTQPHCCRVAGLYAVFRDGYILHHSKGLIPDFPVIPVYYARKRYESLRFR
jgi:hypothetical protein